MTSLSAIESIRQRYRPTLATPTLPANMGFEGYANFRGSFELEWYEQHPHSLALIVNPPSQLPKVWEVARDLFGYALAEPFREFGLGDVRVVAYQPSPVFISLCGDAEWFTVKASRAAAVAKFIHATHLLVPHDRDLVNKPYTPVRTRP